MKIELLDKRIAEAWISHWESIEENGCIPIYLVCDGGTALAKAHDEFLPDLIKQLDTYHAIAHILEGKIGTSMILCFTLSKSLIFD